LAHSDGTGRAPSYAVGSWLLLRLLGLIYLIACVSLWVQLHGLIGFDGILPVADYLDLIRDHTGPDRYWRVPTLLWIADGDTALHILCAAGSLLALALTAGLAPRTVLFLLWACYLSLAQAGQVFLGFQWDTLLLETSFCALFIAPRGWRPVRLRHATPPPACGRWLLWLLLFKLLVLSGAVKPLSFDETWLQLTALEYHYWTQPLPNGLAWYAHGLPSPMHQLSIVVTYAVEIVLPFGIFVARWGPRWLAAGTFFLMSAIAWTGNFGFFNLLAVALCLLLIDDALWRRLRFLPTPAAGGPAAPTGRPARWRGWFAAVCVASLIGASALTAVRELAFTVPPDAGGIVGTAATKIRGLLPQVADPLLRAIQPYRTINGYGLFRSMTQARPEIVIEGSRDGRNWKEYAFRWKPGDPARRPPFVAPHMPRLDWQMWFAALDPPRALPWLTGLLRGLLRGTPRIVALLASDPFHGEPPRYVRLLRYDYRFATPAERRQRGVWWVREPTGALTRPLTLADIEARRPR